MPLSHLSLSSLVRDLCRYGLGDLLTVNAYDVGDWIVLGAWLRGAWLKLLTPCLDEFFAIVDEISLLTTRAFLSGALRDRARSLMRNRRTARGVKQRNDDEPYDNQRYTRT